MPSVGDAAVWELARLSELNSAKVNKTQTIVKQQLNMTQQTFKNAKHSCSIHHLKTVKMALTSLYCSQWRRSLV